MGAQSAPFCCGRPTYPAAASRRLDVTVDARLESNVRELYETRTGGESWSLRQASANPIRFPKTKDAGSAGWRIRADSSTKSYAVEKSEGQRWQKVASFLVHAGTCKQ